MNQTVNNIKFINKYLFFIEVWVSLNVYSKIEQIFLGIRFPYCQKRELQMHQIRRLE